MRTLIDTQWLDRHCQTPAGAIMPAPASMAAQGLGGLACWWLHPQALEAARQSMPPAMQGNWREPACASLPPHPGACWLIAGLEDHHWLTLRRALMLPVVWSRTSPSDPCLPPAFHQVGKSAIQALRPHLQHTDWSLQLDRTVAGDLDLSGIPLEPESAWAALAAGLLIADRGGRPRPRTWASGVWQDGRGFHPAVGMLEQKLGLAQACGVEIFFVPRSQGERARELAGELAAGRPGPAMRIETFPDNEPDPLKALEPIRLELQIPPGREATIEQRKEWAQLLPRIELHRQYHREVCLPDEIKLLRENQPDTLGKVTHLVLTVSGGVQGLLPIGALRPLKCLLLHTDSFQTDAESLERDVLRFAPECQVDRQLFQEGDAMREDLADRVHRFTREVVAAPEQVAFDLTGGKVAMKMNLALHAAPAGSVLCCIDSGGFDKRNRPVPFTQQWQVWRAPGPLGSGASDPETTFTVGAADSGCLSDR